VEKGEGGWSGGWGFAGGLMGLVGVSGHR